LKPFLGFQATRQKLDALFQFTTWTQRYLPSHSKSGLVLLAECVCRQFAGECMCSVGVYASTPCQVKPSLYIRGHFIPLDRILHTHKNKMFPNQKFQNMNRDKPPIFRNPSSFSSRRILPNPTESLPFWSLSHCCWNAAAEGLSMAQGTRSRTQPPSALHGYLCGRPPLPLP